jgi:hypothetical protein
MSGHDIRPRRQLLIGEAIGAEGSGCIGETLTWTRGGMEGATGTCVGALDVCWTGISGALRVVAGVQVTAVGEEAAAGEGDGVGER